MAIQQAAVPENGKPGEKQRSRQDSQREGLLTLREVSAYLRVSPATVRRLTNSGQLPCYRLRSSRSPRLFSKEHVLGFLVACEDRGRAAPHSSAPAVPLTPEATHAA